MDNQQSTQEQTSSKEFNPLAWLVEGAVGFAGELKDRKPGLPDEFWQHSSAAHKEGLLAMRSLLDAMIERCDDKMEKHAQKQSAKEKREERRGEIAIEF